MSVRGLGVLDAPFTVVSKRFEAFGYCILHPAEPAISWLGDVLGAIEKGVPLEVEPESSVEHDPRFVPSQQQDWPRHAIEYLRATGLEVGFTATGLPLIGKMVLDPGLWRNWHNLTIAFGLPKTSATLDDALALRADVLRSLDPTNWHSLPSLKGLLSLLDGEYAVVLARSEEAIVAWLAKQLQFRFVTLVEEADNSKAIILARWLFDNAIDRGVRLRSVSAELNGILALGDWGRGAHSLIRYGASSGSTFRHFVELK